MPTRYLWLQEWADPQTWTALLMSMAAFCTALATLWKALHNSSRLTSVESDVRDLQDGGATNGASEPTPRA